MRRLVVCAMSLFIALPLAVPVWAAGCVPIAFMADGQPLTAAVIDGPLVTGPVDAAGCDIGDYYPAGTSGTITSADIHGARYFGIVVDAAAVDVSSSDVHNIGDTPFDGAQHGIGIYYVNGASGTISSNSIYGYQKGGIVINGEGTTATVASNDVRGLGPVDFIAQNGIQVSRGAVADVRENTIADNYYTGHVGVGPNPGGQNPPGWEYYSTALLLFQADTGTHTSENHFFGNQHNKAVVP